MLTSKVGVDGGSVDNNYGIKGGTGEPGGSLGGKNGVKFPSRLSLLSSSLLSLNFLESLNSFNFFNFSWSSISLISRAFHKNFLISDCLSFELSISLNKLPIIGFCASYFEISLKRTL